MLEQLAILLAVWYAGRMYRAEKMRSKIELFAYHEQLRHARTFLQAAIVESDDSSEATGQITTLLIEVLDARIEELDELIRLDPLIVGTLRK